MTAKPKSDDGTVVSEVGCQAVVIERLSNLHEDIREIKSDIKDQAIALKDQLVQVQNFLLSNTQEHGEMVFDAKRAHSRIDETNITLGKVEKKVEDLLKLAPFLKVEAFLVAGLSIPLIIWLVDMIWKLITHQIILSGL